MSIKLAVNSFNAGEFSPLLAARYDLPKFRQGCRVLQNMVPRMFGGAHGRPGMVHRGEVGNSDMPARLYDFDFSANTRLVIEMQPGTFRFWKDGEILNQTVSGVSAWSGTAAQYDQGKWVKDNNTWHAAKTTHVPSGGNQPPSASWTSTNVKAWAPSTSYAVGDFVISPTAWYPSICTTAHTSPASYSASNFNANFGAFTSITTGWLTGATYTVGFKVVRGFAANNRFFRCKLAHTASSGSAPGTGASWTTYWEEVSSAPNHSTASKVYVAGDFVKVGTDLYFATSNHTSSASNEPTDVGSPWSKMTGVKAWDGTSTARSAGDIVFYGELYAYNTSITTTTYLLFANASSYVALSYIHSSNQVVTWTASPSYALGQIVYDGTPKVLYLCVQQHSTAATTQPGTAGGLDYWQPLANIYYWETGTNYVAGQYVYDPAGAHVYKVAVTHTASSIAAAVSAGQIVTSFYPLTLDNPYAEDDLFGVQHCQVNNWVYFVHPNYPVQKLIRVSDAAWKVGPVAWGFPALEDENFEEKTVAVGSTTKGASTTLTASQALFTADHVGSVFGVSHYRNDSLVSLTFATGTVTGSSLRVLDAWEFTTYGVWNGKAYLELSDDNGTTWNTWRSYEGQNDHNIIDSGQLSDECLMRIKYINASGTPATNPHGTLRVANTKLTGLVRIDSVASSSVANVTVLESPWSTSATKYWAKGAWDKVNGYPRACCLHEQRLWFGGTQKEPRIVWGSVIGDFEVFKRTTLDDASVAYLAEGKANAVQWMASQGGNLLVGTAGDELILGSGDPSSPITPTKIQAKIQGENGSAYIPAVKVNEVTLFIERDGRTVREFVYAFEKDGWVAQRMTLLAEHVTRSGIKQVALATKPDIIFWAVTNDNQLIGMTYERAQEVVAWHRHVTDGEVESVTVIGGEVGGSDEVWFVVKRTVNGATKRFIERFDPFHWKKVEDSNLPFFCGLDCAKIIETTGAVTGLDHLNGKLVTVMLDGTTVETHTVAGGSITPTAAHAVAVVGLPFEPYVEPNDFSIEMQDGSSVGRYQRISHAQLHLWQSASGVQVRHNTSADWESVPFVDDPADVPPAVFTGLRPISLSGEHNRQLALAIRQSSPHPIGILALNLKADVNGD